MLVLHWMILMIFSPPDPVTRTAELSYCQRSHGEAGCSSAAAYVRHSSRSERPTVANRLPSIVFQPLVYCNLTEREGHVWNCHSDPGVTAETVSRVIVRDMQSELFLTQEILFESCLNLLFSSVKEELKEIKKTSLLEDERVKAVLQGLRRWTRPSVW